MRSVEPHVYFAAGLCRGLPVVKIGCSTQVKQRLRNLSMWFDGRAVALLGYLPHAGFAGERAAHRRFSEYQLRPRTAGPGHEWFCLAEAITAYVEEHCHKGEPPRAPWRMDGTAPEPLLKPDDVTRLTGLSVKEARRVLPVLRLSSHTIRFRPADVRAWQAAEGAA